MKIIRYFVIILICLLGYFLVKKTQANMKQILPEHCVFLVDDGLSYAFQGDLTSSICAEYAKTKDPQDVIVKMSQQFPEVNSMKVHLCQTDKICFSLELQKPLFLLNGTQVVCASGAVIPKDHFSLDVVGALTLVSSHGEPNILNMCQFFEKLPESIQQNFEINWVSDTEIVLQENNNKKIFFVVSMHSIPSEQDIRQCKLIQESLPAKNKKKSMSYDLRFKNQIVVR